MKVLRHLDDTYDPSRGCVLAVGNFDGVHRGHQRVFETAVRMARRDGSEPVLLTFSTHPLHILRPEAAPPPIMAAADRLRIAGRYGFETAFLLDFNLHIAAMSPEEFVREILVEGLGVRSVVAGEGWRFGRGRQGDMETLGRLGRQWGFEVEKVPPVLSGEDPVSSTRVREALTAGEVQIVRELLGRTHFIRGTVQRGEGRGRQLGFPTVNLDCHGILTPGEGVYAGAYMMKEGTQGLSGPASGPAAISIGSAPTFPDGSFAVEAHLCGWKGDLYGRRVTVLFSRHLRDQRPFPDMPSLARQIARDVRMAEESFDPRELEEIP